MPCMHIFCNFNEKFIHQSAANILVKNKYAWKYFLTFDAWLLPMDTKSQALSMHILAPIAHVLTLIVSSPLAKTMSVYMNSTKIS